MISIRMPKRLMNSYNFDFLKQAEILFQHKNKSTPNVQLRYDRVQEMTLFSQLLLYKFISYSSENKCFHNPRLALNEYVTIELKKSGFDKLIDYHIKKDQEEEKPSIINLNFFKKKESQAQIDYLTTALQERFENNFYIAPLRLNRDEPNKIRLQSEYINKIEKFYSYNQKIVEIVSKCLTEIYMNFWEHATIDSGTVMVAEGNKEKFELIFADNGNGIISTLTGAGYYNKTDLLSIAVNKGVTSKPLTNHMGWGLWIVSTLCEINNGSMEIFSEGKYLGINGRKKIIKNCGYWKGTIIALSIPLISPKTLSSIFNNIESNIKINWG